MSKRNQDGIIRRRGAQTDTAVSLVTRHARRKKSVVSLEQEGRLIEGMILGERSPDPTIS